MIFKELGVYGITDLHTKFIHHNVSSKDVWKLSETDLKGIGLSPKEIEKYYRAKEERENYADTKEYQGN